MVGRPASRMAGRPDGRPAIRPNIYTEPPRYQITHHEAEGRVNGGGAGGREPPRYHHQLLHQYFTTFFYNYFNMYFSQPNKVHLYLDSLVHIMIIVIIINSTLIRTYLLSNQIGCWEGDGRGVSPPQPSYLIG